MKSLQQIIHEASGLLREAQLTGDRSENQRILADFFGVGNVTKGPLLEMDVDIATAGRTSGRKLLVQPSIIDFVKECVLNLQAPGDSVRGPVILFGRRGVYDLRAEVSVLHYTLPQSDPPPPPVIHPRSGKVMPVRPERAVIEIERLYPIGDPLGPRVRNEDAYNFSNLRMEGDNLVWEAPSIVKSDFWDRGYKKKEDTQDFQDMKTVSVDRKQVSPIILIRLRLILDDPSVGRQHEDIRLEGGTIRGVIDNMRAAETALRRGINSLISKIRTVGGDINDFLIEGGRT